MFEQAEQVLGLTLYTEAFIVRGDVRTRRRRLSDVLNDAEHEFVVLRDVELTEFGTERPPVRSEYAQVNFDAILFAVASERIEPTPEMRLHKLVETAFISIPPFSVVGRIHLMPEPDISLGLDELTARFIPVTDAAFWADLVRVPRRTAPMIAVNHARAQILAPYLEGEIEIADVPDAGASGHPEARRTDPA
jgi:hypothetical protein